MAREPDGRLAMPSLIAQALAPSAGAYATLGLLALLATANLCLAAVLWALAW